MEGLTFDTGALIALERKKQRMAKVLAVARLRNVPITVPAAVVAEWWRGQREPALRALLRGVKVEPVTEAVALAAGAALAVTGGRNAVDAMVMASAASRGDVVYTSDYGDITKLQVAFPAVRVLKA